MKKMQCSTNSSVKDMLSRQELSFPSSLTCQSDEDNRGRASGRFGKYRLEHRRLADEYNAEVGDFIVRNRFVCRSFFKSRGKQATCLRKMRHNQE